VKDQRVPPDGGYQLGDESMILMGIVGARSEHQIRTVSLRDVFESLFHFFPTPGKPSVR